MRLRSVATALGVMLDTLRAEREGSAGLQRRQQRRLADLVRYARTASPYFRSLYEGLPSEVTDPLLLPPTGKRDLMEHFDQWVTDPDVTLDALRRDFLADPALVGARYLDRYHVFTTSGTTGEPAVLLHDSYSWTVLQVVSRFRARASLLTWRDALTVLRRGVRSAGVYVTGGHFGAVVLIESIRRRIPWLAKRARAFSALSPLREIVAGLNEFQPTFLSAYPSALAQLAEEQTAGRLRIAPVLTMCAGESLTPAVAEKVRSAFGCRILQGYAASEVPALSLPCRQGSLHLNADWYLLEPVDEDYRPVPPGTPSYTVLVTNLANRVQPVIRYDLGDRVELVDAPCPCGSPLPVVTVEGRTNDVLSIRANGRSVMILPLALGTVVEETPGVRRFQVLQTGPSTLSVRLELSPSAEPSAVWRRLDERLEQFFSAQGIPQVTVLHAEEGPRLSPRSGKLRQVLAQPRDLSPNL
jgi:phenylacetate-coenzyme A ligase PaaK-like adenylate-forming protein